MKFFLLFTVVAIATSQNPVLSKLAQVCGNLDQNTCQTRVDQCVIIRKSSEDAPAYRLVILECAQQFGISRPQIIAAIQAAAIAQVGEVFDNLPVDDTTVLDMRRCVFTKTGLIDANGNPNHDTIKARLEGKYRSTLASNPAMLQVMLNALTACPRPTDVKDVTVFRTCLTETCVQNFV